MTRHRKAVAPLVAAIVAGALAGAAHAGATEPITLTARLAQPVMTSGERQVNFLRVGLNGCAPQRNADRTPVNVALVIDRSGSMSGERIAQAREAAVMAIKRLDDRDIASLVIFDDRIDVPVPAQKVADRNYFVDRIMHFSASDADVAANADKIVMESVIEQTTRERAARAVVLRDQGRTAEARALLGQNASEIAYLARTPSAALSAMSKQYDGLVTGLAKPGQWNEQGKLLRQMDPQGASVGTRY